MTLTDAQFRNLKWLYDKGGSGYIDRYGRVVAGGDVAPQGAYVAWLRMISEGLIAGDNGRIEVTPKGEQHLIPF